MSFPFDLGLRTLAPIALGCALLGGCANDTDALLTTAIDPSAIVATAGVTSNGSAATIQLTWFAKTDTAHALELGPGDRLVVRAPDAAARDLAHVGDGYYALLPTTASTVTIALVRPAGELAVDVPLPPPFTVTGPAGPVPRSQPIAIAWDVPAPGTEGPVELTVDSPCFGSTIRRTVAKDTGAFTFYPGDFGSGVASCTLAIAVTRRSGLTVKTPWSMSVGVRQVRTLNLETTP